MYILNTAQKYVKEPTRNAPFSNIKLLCRAKLLFWTLLWNQMQGRSLNRVVHEEERKH